MELIFFQITKFLKNLYFSKWYNYRNLMIFEGVKFGKFDLD